MLTNYQDTAANRAVRKPGQRIIDNRLYDRQPAVSGEMDPSKMVISCDVKVVKKNGAVIPNGKVHYRFRHQVRWDDVKSVKKLQRCRAQNFGRYIGPIRPARQTWLESERDVLFDVTQQHLVDVGGRW